MASFTLSPCFTKTIQYLAIPICILVYLFQMVMYDYLLIKHSDIINVPMVDDLNRTAMADSSAFSPWYLWVVPDTVVLALFITAFVKCHQHFSTSTVRNEAVGRGGELPFGYIAWGVYSLLSAVKVGIIFRWIAPLLGKDDLFGLNMPKTAVALSCVIFVTLVLNHHDAEPGSERESLIHFIMQSVTMDVLDTVEFLHVLFYKESGVVLTFFMHRVVIAVACINLMLPTVLLVALSKSKFGRDAVWKKRLQALHKIIQVIVINIPLLVLRVILWHVHEQTISVFLVKNCMALGFMVRSAYLMTFAAVGAGRERKGQFEQVEMEDRPARHGRSTHQDDSEAVTA